MDYLLKASGLVIILLIFYYVFLKNETFFKSIRSYFLLGLIVIISIPLIEIPVYVEQVTSPLNLLDYDIFATNQTSVEKAFNRTQLFTQLYSIGVILFSFKFLVQLASLLLLISKHKPIKQGNFIFIETSKEISPFSFFNIIIYNKEQFSIEELEQIINHEKAHASQWHSIDTILVHILVILLWFNPFAWLYKKSTQQNLEFLADSHALKLSKNEQLYQLTLLKTCTVNYGTAITTNFYNSLIKKRIVMLHKNPTHHKGQWKYALLLPLLIAFVFIFNTKIIAQEKNPIEIKEINNSKAELVIDKNSNEESLKKEEAFFKKEFNINLSFKGIQRNSSNEITSIKIEAKGEKAQAKFENAGSEPIKPIKLSYDSKVNSISIGNLDRRKKGNYSYITHEESDVEMNYPEAEPSGYQN